MRTKEKIVSAVQALPDEATYDDAISHLFLLKNVELAEKEIEAGLGIPHEEALKRIEEWKKRLKLSGRLEL